MFSRLPSGAAAFGDHASVTQTMSVPRRQTVPLIYKIGGRVLFHTNVEAGSQITSFLFPLFSDAFP